MNVYISKKPRSNKAKRAMKVSSESSIDYTTESNSNPKKKDNSQKICMNDLGKREYQGNPP